MSKTNKAAKKERKSEAEKKASRAEALKKRKETLASKAAETAAEQVKVVTPEAAEYLKLRIPEDFDKRQLKGRNIGSLPRLSSFVHNKALEMVAEVMGRPISLPEIKLFVGFVTFERDGKLSHNVCTCANEECACRFVEVYFFDPSLMVQTMKDVLGEGHSVSLKELLRMAGINARGPRHLNPAYDPEKGKDQQAHKYINLCGAPFEYNELQKSSVYSKHSCLGKFALAMVEAIKADTGTDLKYIWGKSVTAVKKADKWEDSKARWERKSAKGIDCLVDRHRDGFAKRYVKKQAV